MLQFAVRYPHRRRKFRVVLYNLVGQLFPLRTRHGAVVNLDGFLKVVELLQLGGYIPVQPQPCRLRVHLLRRQPGGGLDHLGDGVDRVLLVCLAEPFTHVSHRLLELGVHLRVLERQQLHPQLPVRGENVGRQLRERLLVGGQGRFL